LKSELHAAVLRRLGPFRNRILCYVQKDSAALDSTNANHVSSIGICT